MNAESTFAQNREIQRTPRASASERGSIGLFYETEMRDCLKRVPWSELSPESQRRIKMVALQHSLFRRMPTQAVYCDPEIYQYLLEHPDLVVGFWERLGVTEIAVKELKENKYLMRETSGTVAQAEVIHRSDNLCIVYAKGQYRAPFLARGIDGETVLFLRSRFGRDKNNEPYVVCALDTFIKIDNAGADFLAKLFATSLGKIADSNFEQTVAFVGHVSDASSVNADSVKNVSRHIKGVRSEVRDDFIDVVDRVCQRTERREDQGSQYAYSVKVSRTEPPGPGTQPSTLSSKTVSRKDEFREDIFDNQAGTLEAMPEKILRGYDAMFPENLPEKLPEGQEKKTEAVGRIAEADFSKKIGRNAGAEITDDPNHSNQTTKSQSPYAVPSLPVGGMITFSVAPADQKQELRSTYAMPLPPGSQNENDSDMLSVPSDSLTAEAEEISKPKGRVVFGTPRIARPDSTND